MPAVTHVQLFAFTCGSVTDVRSAFLEGESGTITVPVPAYLIVHGEGRVLFDTGLNIALQQADVASPPAQAIEFPPGTDIASHLARLGLEPSDIRYVVNSHLHFDHCGGNAFFPKATLIVHAREWRAAGLASTQAAGIYNPVNFDHMASVRTLDGELDLFGDGSVVVFPTPGHTPGHQSLRVRLASGDIVLAADCCYLKQTLDTLHLPGSAYNRTQMLDSLALMRRLQGDGMRIFFGHDAAFWDTVPKAPSPVI
ncbi:MAG TPA: N-acyl homoserine lactonase family protein [Rhizomicrobium sp.]|jgi:N-acyl homoserine lactone hydrolase|nr:N-acyl homoserine lactonase family protein [Rhizomicrobium sp.]